MEEQYIEPQEWPYARRESTRDVWRNRVRTTGALFASVMGLSYLLGRGR